MEFEPGLAFLRYLKVGDTEILRGIYAAVRDSTWLTVLPAVTGIELTERSGGFQLTFVADCIDGPIAFRWRGLIEGSAAGSLRFSFDGEALTTFRRNRIGFCVLHPMAECAGQPYTAELSSGRTVIGQFPDHISPHQPVMDLRAITHTVQPGLQAEVRFEGDVFEMEDHRNWTDGNYKTYCTPLARPWPVEIRKGTRIQQSIVVTLKGTVPSSVSLEGRELVLKPSGAPAVPLPRIGVTYAVTSPRQWQRLALARPSHLRVDCPLDRDNSGQLEAAARSGLPLEIAALVTDDAEAQLTRLAELRVPSVARWLVLHKTANMIDEKWLRLARKLLKGAPVGGGTNVYFTELNRQRPAAGSVDVACYSINPQVHAFDDRSLMENLEPQAATVRTAKSFLGTTPVAVTPVTLRPRFNPQAPPEERGSLAPDPRQSGLFGAVWTLGSIKYLAEAGAASVTYYETAGPGGWTGGAGVHPLFHVLADVQEYTGAEVVPMSSNSPLETVALLLRRGARSRLLVANLTLDPKVVRVEGVAADNYRVLDERNFQQATDSPEAFRTARVSVHRPVGPFTLGLPPYSVTRVDG